jgi:hypothetical protein
LAVAQQGVTDSSSSRESLASFEKGCSRESLAEAAAESHWQRMQQTVIGGGQRVIGRESSRETWGQRQQQKVTGRGSSRESLAEEAAESHW